MKFDFSVVVFLEVFEESIDAGLTHLVTLSGHELLELRNINESVLVDGEQFELLLVEVGQAVFGFEFFDDLFVGLEVGLASAGFAGEGKLPGEVDLGLGDGDAGRTDRVEEVAAREQAVRVDVGHVEDRLRGQLLLALGSRRLAPQSLALHYSLVAHG